MAGDGKKRTTNKKKKPRRICCCCYINHLLYHTYTGTHKAGTRLSRIGIICSLSLSLSRARSRSMEKKRRSDYLKQLWHQSYQAAYSLSLSYSLSLVCPFCWLAIRK